MKDNIHKFNLPTTIGEIVIEEHIINGHSLYCTKIGNESLSSSSFYHLLNKLEWKGYFDCETHF